LAIDGDNNYEEAGDDDEEKVIFQGETTKLMNVLRERVREGFTDVGGAGGWWNSERIDR
jgi:hypothetical protein